jgi:hypothetical protein
MFRMNFITGPLFIAGFMNGLNARTKPEFQPDPRAHYKLMANAIGFSTALGIAQHYKENPPLMKSRLSAHMIGGAGAGVFVSGMAYCTGLLLTKIPSKTSYE